jgi:hypothetical protein
MKKTLKIPIEFELGKLEITCEVIKIERPDEKNHPDSNINHMVTEFFCTEILDMKHDGEPFEVVDQTSLRIAIGNLLDENSNMWDE